jgi:hypothetical protein
LHHQGKGFPDGPVLDDLFVSQSPMVHHLNCRGDTLRRGEARNDSLTGAFTCGSDDHLRVIGNQVGRPLIRHSGEVLSW